MRVCELNLRPLDGLMSRTCIKRAERDLARRTDDQDSPRCRVDARHRLGGGICPGRHLETGRPLGNPMEQTGFLRWGYPRRFSRCCWRAREILAGLVRVDPEVATSRCGDTGRSHDRRAVHSPRQRRIPAPRSSPLFLAGYGLSGFMRRRACQESTTINAEIAEHAWFDRLTMSAHPELVEGRVPRSSAEWLSLL